MGRRGAPFFCFPKRLAQVLEVTDYLGTSKVSRALTMKAP